MLFELGDVVVDFHRAAVRDLNFFFEQSGALEPLLNLPQSSGDVGLELRAFFGELGLLLTRRLQVIRELLLQLLETLDVAFDLFEPLALLGRFLELAIHVPTRAR